MQSKVETKQETIEHILNTAKTIAVVGFSTKPHKAGYYVPEYLQKQGYRIIPVNPVMEKDKALGEQVYESLKDIPVPVDVVDIFRRPEHIPPIVDEAIEIGAKAVWMQLGIRNEEAAEKAIQAGLLVVQDACMLAEHKRR